MKVIEDRTENLRDLRKTRSKLAPLAHGQRVTDTKSYSVLTVSGVFIKFIN